MSLKERLEQVAYNESINISYSPISFAKSFIFSDPYYNIVIDRDQILTDLEEAVHLAHELGHYFTGCMYYRDSPLQTKGRCEYRANVWMVKAICPINKLKKAIASGSVSTWELAEEMNLPEDLIKQAIYIYQCKGII